MLIPDLFVVSLRCRICDLNADLAPDLATLRSADYWVTITTTETCGLFVYFNENSDLRYGCGSDSWFRNSHCGSRPDADPDISHLMVAISANVPVVLSLTSVPLIHGHSGVGAARCCGGRQCAAARSHRRPGAHSRVSAVVCGYSLSVTWSCHEKYIFKYVIVTRLVDGA